MKTTGYTVFFYQILIALFGCDFNLQEQTTTTVHEAPIQLTNDGWPKFTPDWSPDGSRIAFSSLKYYTKLSQVAFDGTEKQELGIVGNHNDVSGRIALSPDGKMIAFHSNRTASLMLADLENNSQEILTNHATDAFDPAWSRDGAWIAYRARGFFGQHKIWIIPAAGGSVTQLTTGVSDDAWPSWSPDGQELAYDSITSEGRSIRVISIESKQNRQVTNDSFNAHSPDWSPDGSKIAFAATRNDASSIWTVPTTGGSPTKLIDASRNPDQPIWSPDGSKIAFIKNDSRILIFSLDSGTGTGTPIFSDYPLWFDNESFIDKRVINSYTIESFSFLDSTVSSLTAFGEDQLIYALTWSPTHNKILLSIRFPGSLYEIWSLDLANSGEEPLTQEIFLDTGQLNPAISSDGNSIIWDNNRDIFMTSLLTSETVNLSEHIAERLIYPSFSPDNQQIACLSENSLKIYQVKSNRLIENTEIPGSFRTVSWSPHNKDFGSHIAVEDNARRISIFTLAVPESKTVIGSGRFPTWSPDGTKIAYISGSELYVLQTLTTLYNVARE